MRKMLLAAAALAAVMAAGAARAQNGVQIQIVPNPQYAGTASHRLACNPWDRCTQVGGFVWDNGAGLGGVPSTANSYFTSGQPPMSGRPGGLDFYRPN